MKLANSIILFVSGCLSLNQLVWPDPLKFRSGKNTLSVPESFKILYNGPNLVLMEDAFKRTYKKMFAFGCHPGSDKGLQVLIVNVQKDFDIRRLQQSQSDEYYSLNIKDGEIFGILNAKSILGALRGLETFSQLIKVSKQVPIWAKSNCKVSQYFINTPISIHDKPAFMHRGLLLDTSRHFMPTGIIKRVLDGMEASKLNVFHWHIIDSQSFPIKSQVLPDLSREGAYSEFEVYSIQDIKEIVEYAEYRGIRVIPGRSMIGSNIIEFDIPGHAYSWRASGLVVCPDAKPWDKYCAEPPCGQLDISKNETIIMLEKFIREMSDVFPSENIHLGHDEVNKNCYLDDPNIRALLKTGMTLDILLQTFQDNIQDISRNMRKIPVFWEEIVLEFSTKVPKDTIIQSWRGVESTVSILEKGFRVIVSDSKAWYLDCKILWINLRWTWKLDNRK